MAGSIYGKHLTITTWGESHGRASGAIVDGCPAGLSLCEEDIQSMLDRRKPGQGSLSTSRKESDTVQILSGVFEGRTTGTPISLLIPNEDQHSADYTEIASYYRPGHADYTFDAKYGFRDYRGGGRSSGRETAGRVAAGAIAKKILTELGINVEAYIIEIAGREVTNGQLTSEITSLLEVIARRGDSAGGVIECKVQGMPAGVGEPVFDKLDACLAKAVMSIGAVKGVEIGDGFQSARALGSTNNDCFMAKNNKDESTKISTVSNHAGGILGGISNGEPIILRAAVKPTASIRSEQQTVNNDGEEITISIGGRHDPVIVPRAVVVVEAMVALTLVDQLFENTTSRMDYLKRIYDVN